MNVAAAWIATAVLTVIAVVQVAAAAGAPVGRFLWGGKHRVLPPGLRVGSAVSVVAYAGFAAVLLARAGVVPGESAPFVVVAAWVLFGYFTLGVVMNAISRSPAERAAMTPAAVVLAAASLVIAMSA